MIRYLSHPHTRSHTHTPSTYKFLFLCVVFQTTQQWSISQMVPEWWVAIQVTDSAVSRSCQWRWTRQVKSGIFPVCPEWHTVLDAVSMLWWLLIFQVSTWSVLVYVLWSSVPGHSTNQRAATNTVSAALHEGHNLASNTASFVLSYHALCPLGHHSQWADHTSRVCSAVEWNTRNTNTIKM